MKRFTIFLSLAVLLYCSAGIAGCKQKNMDKKDHTTNVLAFRLKPGVDLQQGIESIVQQHKVGAGWIATCVGSLTDYRIRFANQEGADTGKGHFEIVSLTGTVSTAGSHLHISIGDSTGKTIGGHLLPGCKVYTTAELVIQYTDKYIFSREEDGTTPWKELQVREKE